VPEEEVGPTPGADADMGGEVVVVIILEIVIAVVILIVDAEARAPERLAETRGASFRATTRVMDTPDGSPAVPTGEVDDPAGAPPLVAPTDGLEETSTDRDGVGQTADLIHHLPIALWTQGHGVPPSLRDVASGASRQVVTSAAVAPGFIRRS
jgi:hypothetical protein